MRSSSRIRTRQTRREAIQAIIDKWRENHPGQLVDMRKVYRWAIKESLYDPPHIDVEKIGAREFSRAAGAQYYTDPQGRAVRKKHAAAYPQGDGTQLFLWGDIEDADPRHMHLAFSQRRGSALGDVKQLKTDKDSFNDNNRFGAFIDMSFNFDEDLAELGHSTDYPEAPPEDDSGI